MNRLAQCENCDGANLVLNDQGLCFACDTHGTLAVMLSEETDLSESESAELAGAMAEQVVSKVIERLNLPDQTHPLVGELLKTMKRTEPTN